MAGGPKNHIRDASRPPKKKKKKKTSCPRGVGGTFDTIRKGLGGEPLIKANLPRTKSNLKKKSRKKNNALTQDRTGRFTAILDFVMNGRSETICVKWKDPFTQDKI